MLRNSWSRHLSLTYNQKYEYVLRVTWVGYEFFGTLALGIYLLKVNPRDTDTKINISVQGETSEEKYLAIICLVLEGFPKFFLVGLTMVHRHSPFRCQALELFRF